ncbi:MAG: hypothetical protein EU532_14535 [Promethearchaeota archaeon]|nr:MAG: hypothetical protein EU532_14535 [Candidatus Lokiarchaeota archaeon]
MPISSDKNIINSIEKGIEAAISCQPYVKSIKINLDREKIKGDKRTQYEYDEVSGKIIRAELVIKYESIEILAKVDWIEDLNYPLMFIEKIKEID